MTLHMGVIPPELKIPAIEKMIRMVRDQCANNTAANLLADQLEERVSELRMILDTPTEQDLYMKELESVQKQRDDAYRAIIMVLQAHILCPESNEDREPAKGILQKLHPIDFITGSLLSDITVLYHRLVWLQEDEQMEWLKKFHLLPFVNRLEEMQNQFDTLMEKRVTARESQGVSLLRATRPLDRAAQTLLAFVKETCEPSCYDQLLAPLLEAQSQAGNLPNPDSFPLY